MDNQHAKEVLARYRPSIDDSGNEEIATALAQARQDPELNRWSTQQLDFNTAVATKLRQIAPPADLKQRILSGRPRAQVIHFWQRPQLLALAAAVVLLLGLSWYGMIPSQSSQLAAYRVRMAKTALREYRMDLLSQDLSQIKAFLAQNNFPADYVLSPEVAKLPGVGCALLKWQDQPVSMVCLDVGKGELLWVFVMNQGSVKGMTAPARPEFAQVGKLATATWSQQGKTYLLARVGDQQAIQKYL
jgi:hypothetical protein